jgi:hypothetical protein
MKSLVIILSILLLSVSFSGCESAEEETQKEKEYNARFKEYKQQRSYEAERGF